MHASSRSENSTVSNEELEMIDECAVSETTEEPQVLYCFHCNRLENHHFCSRNTWYHSFLLGFTFGGIVLLGPFRCLCCGALRFFSFDEYHPRVMKAKVALQLRKLSIVVSRKTKELLNRSKFLQREND